jgi:hypothetical protein
MAIAPRGNNPVVAGPLDQLNDPGEVFRNPGQLEFVRNLVRLLKDAFGKAVIRDQASPFIHLQAPNGGVYKVSVGDTGALRVEYVRG